MVEHILEPRAIYREQVDSVFKLLPIMLLADFLAAGILVLFVYITASNYTYLMYVWLGSVAVLTLIRAIITKYFQLAATIQDNLDARSNLLLGSIFVSGLIWGTTWLIMPFGSLEPPRGAVILWPCVVLAGSVANLAVLKRLYIVLTTVTIALQVAYLIVQGNPQDLQLAFAFTVYALFFLLVGNRLGNDLLRGITLKLQNEQLSASLRQDRITLKENEVELFKQIEREKQLLEEKRKTDTKLELAVEEKLLLLDAAGEGIFGTNANGQVTFMNAMALKLLQFNEDDVIGQDALTLITRTNDSGENQARRLIINCFQKGHPVSSKKGNFFGKKDLLLPVNFSCRPIIKAEIFVGAVVSFFDMTEQMQMENRLVQSQKMEAIGRIIGGVAHDFNNLITAIMGNLQFLKKRLLDGDSASGINIIEKLMQASKRGAELNNRLLSYSREQALQREAEDLGGILSDMQDFFTRTLGEEIRFSLQVEGVSNYAMVDRARFENALLNLCLNAKDAMPSGGELRISCQRRQLELAPKAGKYDDPVEVIEISVTDTGTGIPAEIQNKIFDPFFTTKKQGEGTGFGLSTSYGFIQQSGGNITVQSQVGQGATFTIQLPAMDQVDIPDRNRHKPTDESRYNGTILAVEDDDNVRDVATMMLVDAGYMVITSSNGPQGLEEFRKNPDINLVFSDIIMPGGMNGIEMARKILEINPRMPILLATGYTEKMLRDRIEDMGNVVCIPKPYDTLKLPGMINDMMRRKTGSASN